MTRKRYWIAGMVLLVLTNIVVLGGVAYNRSGEPLARVTLTERELQLPYRYWNGEEDSGIALRLNWRVATENVSGLSFSGALTPLWLGEQKLRELGFDVRQQATADRSGDYAWKIQPREVYLVLEHDGPAYQTVLAQARGALRRNREQLAANPMSDPLKSAVAAAESVLSAEETARSRLFVIDAGLDRAALRAQYPDRTMYLILRGQVRVDVDGGNGEQRYAGYVSELGNALLNVPLKYRDTLDPLLATGTSAGRDAPPRYQVELALGKRLEPWVIDIAAIE